MRPSALSPRALRRLAFTRTRLAASLSAALVLGTPYADAMTLEQALQAALRYDPTLQSATYDQASSREARVIGRANLLPNVSANYSRSDVAADRTITTAGRPVNDKPNYLSESASISMRQPLFNLEAYARYKQGDTQSNYGEAVLAAKTQDLYVRLFAAYAEVLLSREQIQLAVAQRDALKENELANQRMFERGAGTKTDMLETKARYELSEAELLEAENSLDTARRKLASITGPLTTPLPTLSPDFKFLSIEPESFEGWEKIALDQNATLIAQRHQVNYAELDLNRAQSGHYPKVDLVASYTDSKSDSLFTFNQESRLRSIGVQMAIPLYSGGSVDAGVRQAVAGVERAKADLAAKTEDVLQELRRQHRLFTSSRARIDALASAEQSSLLVIDATRKSIAGGARINLDLLNAEKQLYTTRRDLAQARYGHLIAYLRLRQAAGVLTGEDVLSLGAYFNN
ncbi:MAG: TolC family outer membrane protein [Betaproteobacteria bacterium]|nr:TolC family outer membrane protein [Betaproteobacteria bacterium]